MSWGREEGVGLGTGVRGRHGLRWRHQGGLREGCLLLHMPRIRWVCLLQYAVWVKVQPVCAAYGAGGVQPVCTAYGAQQGPLRAAYTFWLVSEECGLAACVLLQALRAGVKKGTPVEVMKAGLSGPDGPLGRGVNGGY